MVDPAGQGPEEGHDDDKLEHHHVVPEVGRGIPIDELPGKAAPVVVVTVLLELRDKD